MSDCETGKWRYETKADATKARLAVSKRRRQTRGSATGKRPALKMTGEYLCKHCGGWHLTSATDVRRRR